MAALSAAQRNQIYNELTDATSESTAEVIMHSVVDAPWDNVVTNDHLDTHFARVESRFAEVDTHFAQIDSRFAQIDTHFAQIDSRFAEVDSRFAEVDSRFAEVETHFARLEGQIDSRFAQSDAKIERIARNMTIWLVSTTFAFNGLLAAWLTAVH